jgi:hypothetical protein
MTERLTQGKGPGQWQRVLMEEYGDNPHWSAILRCPTCDVRVPITNHNISAEGQVTPSVSHSCSWHPTPMLVGWAPCPPTPQPKPYVGECAKCGKNGRQLGGWGIAGGYPLLCAECIRPFIDALAK